MSQPIPKAGDTVHLKSGGPSMTVCPKDGYGSGNPAPVYSQPINCVWFDNQGRCYEREFPLNCLI